MNDPEDNVVSVVVIFLLNVKGQSYMRSDEEQTIVFRSRVVSDF